MSEYWELTISQLTKVEEQIAVGMVGVA